MNKEWRALPIVSTFFLFDEFVLGLELDVGPGNLRFQFSREFKGEKFKVNNEVSLFFMLGEFVLDPGLNFSHRKHSQRQRRFCTIV